MPVKTYKSFPKLNDNQNTALIEPESEAHNVSLNKIEVWGVIDSRKQNFVEVRHIRVPIEMEEIIDTHLTHGHKSGLRYQIIKWGIEELKKRLSEGDVVIKYD